MEPVQLLRYHFQHEEGNPQTEWPLKTLRCKTAFAFVYDDNNGIYYRPVGRENRSL